MTVAASVTVAQLNMLKGPTFKKSKQVNVTQGLKKKREGGIGWRNQ